MRIQWRSNAKAALGIFALILLPAVTLAADDDQLGSQLYEQAKVKSKIAVEFADKMQSALDRGDMVAMCGYAKDANRATKAVNDLAVRMINLDMDWQNEQIAQTLYDKSKASLDDYAGVLELPECGGTADVVTADAVVNFDFKNNRLLNELKIGVGQARDDDTEGTAAFANGRWNDACRSLRQASQWYGFNSRYALEVSAEFATKNDPQPQLQVLSIELAGLDKAAATKRDQACLNDLYGRDVSNADLPAKDRTDIAALDTALKQQQILIDQFYSARSSGNVAVACPLIAKIITGQSKVIAQSASILTRYDNEALRKQDAQIVGTLDSAKRLKTEMCSAVSAKP